jgi:hypothetical protein
MVGIIVGVTVAVTEDVIEGVIIDVPTEGTESGVGVVQATKNNSKKEQIKIILIIP